MVEIGLKSYCAAIQHFTLCVSAPTHVLNTIMLEAYKKCLMCSLIETGDLPKLPKYTSPTITRPIKNHLVPYNEFADAFAGGKPAELRAAFDKHAGAFTADHNLGLAKQCVASLMRRSIRTLTETYLTLSLPHIAEMASAANALQLAPLFASDSSAARRWIAQVYLPNAATAEKQLRDMIVVRQIHATIDAQKGMVHGAQQLLAMPRGRYRVLLPKCCTICLAPCPSTTTTCRGCPRRKDPRSGNRVTMRCCPSELSK